MELELTDEEKLEIINQHVKMVLNSEYNLSLTIKEQKSILEPDTAILDSLSRQLYDISEKKKVLEAEIDLVNGKSKSKEK